MRSRKTMKKILIAATFFLPAPAKILAGDNHNHEASVEPAPHGGTLRDVGDFKAEAVLKGDLVTIHIYDNKLKPLKLDKETLTGEIQFPKQDRKKVTFKKTGETYQLSIDGISKIHRYDLHLDLEIKGKKARVDFGIDNI